MIQVFAMVALVETNMLGTGEEEHNDKYRFYLYGNVGNLWTPNFWNYID